MFQDNPVTIFTLLLVYGINGIIPRLLRIIRTPQITILLRYVELVQNLPAERKSIVLDGIKKVARHESPRIFLRVADWDFLLAAIEPKQRSIYKSRSQDLFRTVPCARVILNAVENPRNWFAEASAIVQHLFCEIRFRAEFKRCLQQQVDDRYAERESLRQKFGKLYNYFANDPPLTTLIIWILFAYPDPGMMKSTIVRCQAILRNRLHLHISLAVLRASVKASPLFVCNGDTFSVCSLLSDTVYAIVKYDLPAVLSLVVRDPALLRGLGDYGDAMNIISYRPVILRNYLFAACRHIKLPRYGFI